MAGPILVHSSLVNEVKLVDMRLIFVSSLMLKLK
jgi:hypothetical protein